MSYRPITDVWILGRPKVKYYGAYPAGFLHRARALLGCGLSEPVLHVCGGMVRQYPYRGFGPNDRTLDLDPACCPDFLRDAREPFPMLCKDADHEGGNHKGDTDLQMLHCFWGAVLIDRPYTTEDAKQYVPGPEVLPTANGLLKRGLAVVDVGGKVGVLDYLWPQPPKNAVEVAVIAVGTGRNARARWFTVFERLS